MTLDLPFLIPLLIVFILCSAFFSGSETAFLGFDWLRLRFLARKGNHRAAILEKILARKERLIATILVGNTIVNIAASSVATAVAISLWGESGIALATAVMTFFLLVFGEIAPKTFAARRAEPVGLLLAPVYTVVLVLLYPLVFIMITASNAVLALFGSKPQSHQRPGLSEEEIRALLSDRKSTGQVAENKRLMLQGVLRISRKKAREIMIPRTRMRALDIATPPVEAAQEFLKSGFTRLPVYSETTDRIVGIAHARDVLQLLTKGGDAELSQAVRDTFFVPENMTLEKLLHEFQKRRTHMAMVVDEFGQVEGLATLEDVLEEIVGEIRDEHDLEGEQVRFLPGGEALVQGHAAIREVNHALKLHIPTDVDVTMGGYAMTSLGHIPEVGESFVSGNVRITVERTGLNRVLLVRVTPLGAPGPRRS